jgi:hypothetical protein
MRNLATAPTLHPVAAMTAISVVAPRHAGLHVQVGKALTIRMLETADGLAADGTGESAKYATPYPYEKVAKFLVAWGAQGMFMLEASPATQTLVKEMCCALPELSVTTKYLTLKAVATSKAAGAAPKPDVPATDAEDGHAAGKGAGKLPHVLALPHDYLVYWRQPHRSLCLYCGKESCRSKDLASCRDTGGYIHLPRIPSEPPGISVGSLLTKLRGTAHL